MNFKLLNFLLNRSRMLLPGLLFLVGAEGIYAQLQIRPEEKAPAFQETIWLQTDRSLYLAGEQITFHAVLLEKDTYDPSMLSKSIRVELMDQNGVSRIRKRIELENAQTSGALLISPDLETGWYYLRAYTNWMRNFPTSGFTVIPVKVVNPADQEVYPQPDSMVAGEMQLTVNNSITITEETNLLQVGIEGLNPDSVHSVTLLMHRSGTWYGVENKKVTGSQISFEVPRVKIPPGIVQFSAISDDKKVLGRKLWSDYDHSKHLITIDIQPTEYSIRGTCEASYNLPDNQKDTARIYLNTLVSLNPAGDSSDTYLPGLPGWTASSEIPMEKKAFDNWLDQNFYPDSLVLSFFKPGSSLPTTTDSIEWPKLNHPGILFLPETRSGVLSGRIINRFTGVTVPAVGVGITTLNDNSFDAIRTNQDGLFFFTFPKIFSQRDYVLSFLTEPDSAWKIETLPDYDNRPFTPGKKDFSLSPEDLDYIRNRNTTFQLQQIYSTRISEEPKAAETRTRNKIFFYPPDRVILTDNYIELANIREVVYEVVPDVQIHHEGNRISLSVYSNKSYSRDYETLILLDGVPLTDQQELLSLPPTRIRAIEVKNKVFIHGGYTFSAIVNFVSRNNDFAGLKLPAQSVLGSYEPPVPAKMPDFRKHASTSPEIPLLNPTLFWKTGKQVPKGTITFSVNDLYGDFRIWLSGFDAKGQWVNGQKRFSVSPPKKKQ